MSKPAKKTIKTWSTPVQEEERISVPCTLCGGTLFVSYYKDAGSNPLFCPENTPEGEASELLFFNYVRCTRCGLVQINPQPAPEAVARRYDTNHGREYLDYEKANEKVFLELQELALRDAGFYDLEKDFFSLKGKEGTFPESENRAPLAMDIGCATGALLLSLKSRGWAVQGVEISGPEAAYCRDRGLKVSTLPLGKNNFTARNFNVVFASHVIEHLNNPFGFVLEVKRILKPQGRFYVTTPNIAGFQARFFGSRWRSAIFDHLYLFSAKTLRALLEKAGFTVELIRTWGGLAEGTAPVPVKRIFDTLAKPLGFGDVMIASAIPR